MGEECTELSWATHCRTRDVSLTDEELMDRNLSVFVDRPTDTHKSAAGNEGLDELRPIRPGGVEYNIEWASIEEGSFPALLADYTSVCTNLYRPGKLRKA